MSAYTENLVEEIKRLESKIKLLKENDDPITDEANLLNVLREKLQQATNALSGGAQLLKSSVEQGQPVLKG